MSSYFKRHERTKDGSDMYSRITLYIPNALFLKLRDKSMEVRLPMSKLLAFAADNEFDQAEPFRYDCDWPTDAYEEDKYIEESAKLLRVISNVPGGLSKDALMLMRHDMGLTKEQVMYALRELLEKQIIEEYRNTASKYNYPPDYYHYRTKIEKPVKMKRYGRK